MPESSLDFNGQFDQRRVGVGPESEQELAGQVPIFQNGSPTKIMDPPTSRTTVLAKFCRDAADGEWFCSAARTPKTWKQVKSTGR